MSVFGCMFLWAVTKKVKGNDVDGLNVWFVDIIMANVTSQDAKDLYCGLDAFRSEIQQKYLIDMAGKRTKMLILSDNKLVDASHSAFINAGNRKAIKDVGGANNQPVDNNLTGPFTPRRRRGEILANRDPDNRFHARLTKWMQDLDRHVIDKPYICRWCTWEAQRGKSELDPHFYYLNKQLTQACLVGGID
jgi:hypothetical protein